MPSRRWKPKTKRRHEDEDISEWQPGCCGDVAENSNQLDKQPNKAMAVTVNLGSRHRALNTKVNDAFAKQVDFDNMKDTSEVTEVDKLFKIDLAAKLKNVDFLIGMLKSGDSLFTARTLKKGDWLFRDEYAHIINPEYLYENIFPVISMRAKRKIIKAAAKNISNPDRAAQFYRCCMDEKMMNTACTCLIYTSEAFKVDILKSKNGPVSELEKKDLVFIRFLVGNSLDILEAFLGLMSLNSNKTSLIVRRFKNLYYSASSEKYLDIAEKYVSTSNGYKTEKFDVKLSESIMNNHKDKVLSEPGFYLNTVNRQVFVKYSTVDDARIYAKAIFPDTGREFWSRRYYIVCPPIYDIITAPEDISIQFLKTFFAENYPETEFEMHSGFYKQKYYIVLTPEERQEWAFRHLKSHKQILGVGNDYVWYKFIKYDVSFPAIKELISITKNAETRNEMVKVLVESAQNNRDLESLFIYYHKRHLNELRTHRESFLNKIISVHNVFKFDKLCWAAFYEVLLSMDLYNTGDATDKKENEEVNKTYKMISVLYHITNDEAFPEELMKYFLDGFCVDDIDDHLNKVGVENYQKLHDFFFDVYTKNVIEFKHQAHSEEVTNRVARYFDNIKSSIGTFHPDYGTESQEDNHPKTRVVDNTLSDRQLLRDLKKDKKLVISKVLDVKNKYETSPFRLNNFLKKIKIYFPRDVTNLYINMFEDLVNENKNQLAVKAGVHGIFELGRYKDKIDFMNRYAPVSPKIDRKNVEVGHLRIQKAICRYASVSRPPMPLSSIVMYMKGSYAKYCLQVFNTYLAALPLPMCLEFVHLVIDAPISIQKHAIRLAFQCFDADILMKVITNLWKNTKNVSMRSVVFKSLFNKVVDTKKRLFFDVLIKFTSSLHQNDENEVFDIVVSNKIPEDFLEEFIESVWKAVDSFENKQPNTKRKEDVTRCIHDNLPVLRKSFVLLIIQKHMDMMIKENNLETIYENDLSQLYTAIWQLVANFIMYYTRSESQHDEFVQMAQYIVKNSIDKWNLVINGQFVYQTFLRDFFDNLQKASLLKYNTGYFEDGIPIFEVIMSLVKSLPIHDTYSLLWDLELAVITRRAVKNNRKNFSEYNFYDVVIDTAEDFSRGLINVLGKSTYLMSYSSDIKEMVVNHVKNILYIIYCHFDDEEEYNVDQFLDDVLVTIAYRLVHNICWPHGYIILAVQLLPNDVSCPEKKFMFVINKLALCCRLEVRCALHQKFRRLCNEINSNVNTSKSSSYKRFCVIL